MSTPRRTFGRYELRGILGEGGFAVVYRALDPSLDREVALKVLRPHLAADPEVRRRFIAEARAIARLRHPNIAIVYEVGQVSEQPFFSMELIEGRTLAQLVAPGQGLPLPQVAHIVAGLASAVDYLHEQGLVHRDIKAANVMVDRFGRVVLMDFGIARALDRTQHTRTGAILGTLETMSPEQVRGQPAGPPADIYALGILTYQLLAGRPPFEGDTAYMLYAHAHQEPPPLRNLRPALPSAIYRALDSALAKNPSTRPPQAEAIANSIRVDRRRAAAEGHTPDRAHADGTSQNTSQKKQVEETAAGKHDSFFARPKKPVVTDTYGAHRIGIFVNPYPIYRWMASDTIGIFAGAIAGLLASLIPINRYWFLSVVALVSASLALGFSQWRVALQRKYTKWWIMLTAGGLVAAVIPYIAVSAFLIQLGGAITYQASLAIYGAFAGLLTAIPQSAVLFNTMFYRAVWLLVNLVGWSIGGALAGYSLGLGSSQAEMRNYLILGLAIALSGGFPGLISGAYLCLLDMSKTILPQRCHP
jgi:hypothetical protein